MGGASGEGRGKAALSGLRCPVQRVRGAGRGCSTDVSPGQGPREVAVCCGGGRVLLPASYYEEVMSM